MIDTPKEFNLKLQQWHALNERDLPWKSNANAYKIWLSEIILQQTQVKQGTPYYLNFVKKYPDIQSFIKADLDDILALWKGLGYYSRARNMYEAAQQINETFDGLFPNNYQDILALKGIGKYTAAAIASFAYELPHAVVDGNVIRLITRYYGITGDYTRRATMSKIESLAQKLMDHAILPSSHNQAMMDFGALQCKPSNPLCQSCPFNNQCIAYLNNQVDKIPFKTPKIKKTTRYFHYLVLMNHKGIILKQRTNEDIWKGLFDLPMIESDSSKPPSEETFFSILPSLKIKKTCIERPIKRILDTRKHILTHQIIFANYYEVSSTCDISRNENFQYFKNLGTIGYPSLFSKFLKGQDL
ncbi:MAG TPA: A/G-specific adenine glycosylase [Saprospiraceae bacterium]|nr:A/G-specific adenine glycosylase [Saprospiraceae bacterium]